MLKAGEVGADFCRLCWAVLIITSLLKSSFLRGYVLGIKTKRQVHSVGNGCMHTVWHKMLAHVKYPDDI